MTNAPRLFEITHSKIKLQTSDYECTYTPMQLFGQALAVSDQKMFSYK